MKIGVFGGTFNPIHLGHIAIAEDVQKAVPLDKILFVPAGDPPHKKEKEIIPSRHRLEMVRLAVKDNPLFEVSDVEIKRSGKSYTVKTIEELKEADPLNREFYFIMGLDAFLEFPSWRDPDRLSALSHLVVVSRPGVFFRQLMGHPFVNVPDLNPLTLLDENKSARCDLNLPEGMRLILLRVSPWDISATEIRNHISGTGKGRNLLPPNVESYIMSHHFFNDPKSLS